MDIDRPDDARVALDFDEYRIVRPLGRGAMGEVFLAHDTALDRQVAIKLACAAGPGSRARERFLSEARALARVRHENVLTVHRIGEVRGRPYMVTEYVPGPCLESLAGTISEPELLSVARALAEALAAVHGAGVLHRDIKPANVVLGPGGAVKLIDFGLAEALSADPSRRASGVESAGPAPAPGGADPGSSGRRAGAATISLDITRVVEAPSDPRGPSEEGSPATGKYRIAGTPLYMAPELWEGAPASPRTDVFALGATIARVASGAGIEDLCAAAGAVRLSRAFAEVLEKAAARRPEQRFPTAEALLRALESIGREGSDPRAAVIADRPARSRPAPDRLFARSPGRPRPRRRAPRPPAPPTCPVPPDATPRTPAPGPSPRT